MGSSPASIPASLKGCRGSLGWPTVRAGWVICSRSARCGAVSPSSSPSSTAWEGPGRWRDFDLNEISITPQRQKAVDFSSPYYTANQAIVVLKSSDVVGAKSLADLKGLEIGVQVGTTSLEAVEDVIQPDSQPQVFNSSNDVITALKNEQIDAVVVDRVRLRSGRRAAELGPARAAEQALDEPGRRRSRTRLSLRSA